MQKVLQFSYPASSRPEKSRRSMNQLKIMRITFFDRRGISFDKAVLMRQTMNGNHYLIVLHKMRRVIFGERLELEADDLIWFLDNADRCASSKSSKH